MNAKKQLTVTILKKTRKASESGKESIKAYMRMKKKILEILKEESKTIPEIAKEAGLNIDEVTYYLMSMRKYGLLTVANIDDDDEYYYYQLKQD